MRFEIKLLCAVVLSLSAAPVLAGGLGDLAKTVLGGKSVLKKAEKKCGSALRLSPKEDATLNFAVTATKEALPAAEFLKLNDDAEAKAHEESQKSNFCDETKKKKKGIISRVGSAGKSLLKKRVGI